jgi:hypothetical protein
MKKIFWLVIIVISFGLISCNSGSQHHSESNNDKSIIKYRRITGKVVNAADMKPIGGSIITFNNPIKNIPVATLTDTEGKFVLDSIPSSVKKITVVNVSGNKSKEVELSEEENIVIKMD